jgi:hypothetical protein
MPIQTTRSHKYFRLDPLKLKRAQKALGAKTETETIERALDLTIAKHDAIVRLAKAAKKPPRRIENNKDIDSMLK